MQKTTQTNHSSPDFEQAGDPLAGSGFEEQDPNPEYFDDTDEEEAIKE